MKQEIQKVKNDYSAQLLSLKHVHTVAIGYKIKNRQVSSELAISVFTTKKKKWKELDHKQRIPSHLCGYPTDVIELPEFEPYQFTDSDIINRRKYRPVPGGAEIYMPNSPFSGGFCTLGMFAHSTRALDDPNDIYLVANAHCFPRADQVIFQPESHDPQDRIAYASRIVNSQLVDGGIAQMLENTQADPYEIIGVGKPLGLYDVTTEDIGKQVIKSGRTTGTTVGILAYLHADADEKKDQIIIMDLYDTAFSDHGDSGSVVLMEEGAYRHHVIALLWGGALNFTVCSPIAFVCEELQISLITEADI